MLRKLSDKSEIRILISRVTVLIDFEALVYINVLRSLFSLISFFKYFIL